ncbi:hypothetical protein [uncultured Dialister sp.]|uniref:hypothetical protein n=1 Tax=uncultured Dialister sp. TaxID=278064 RepID=UPI0026DCB530|nr:hypothetical protein [uncultured Dialister sp.]
MEDLAAIGRKRKYGMVFIKIFYRNLLRKRAIFFGGWRFYFSIDRRGRWCENVLYTLK